MSDPLSLVRIFKLVGISQNRDTTCYLQCRQTAHNNNNNYIFRIMYPTYRIVLWLIMLLWLKFNNGLSLSLSHSKQIVIPVVLPLFHVHTAYEEQVVAFFRQPDIVSIISGRYHRGVRPQLRDIIAGVRMEGTTALERIQMSGSIATYELAIVLRWEQHVYTQLPQSTPAGQGRVIKFCNVLYTRLVVMCFSVPILLLVFFVQLHN